MHLERLRRSSKISLLLVPPRASFTVSPSLATRGPQDAPVTVVEFGDFECPYCRKLFPVLALLEDEYKGQIRRAFVHYPLERIHKHASKAATFAECAREVGAFWPAHEWLFSNPQVVGALEAVAFSKALGLAGPDEEAIARCVESPRPSATWRREAGLASRLGVSGTPTVFINGRLVAGAHASSVYRDIIEEEIVDAAAHKASAKKP